MKLTKLQFQQQYQKSLVQEKTAYEDLKVTIQNVRNPGLQIVSHYLIEGEEVADRDRQLENTRVTKHLQQLKKQVNELKDIMSQKERKDNLKNILLILQNNLFEARSGWQQANLSLEERNKSLSQEILLSQRKLQDIKNMVLEKPKTESPQKPAPHVDSNAYNANMPQQLRIIEDELQRINYPNGGWEPDTHERFWLLFLQSRNQNRRVFAEKIAKDFPLFTLNALLRHDEFCLKVQELLEKKKRFFEKQKQIKEIEKQELKDQEIVKQKLQNEQIKQIQTVTDSEKEKIRARKERLLMQKQEQISQIYKVKVNEQRQFQMAVANAEERKKRQEDNKIRKQMLKDAEQKAQKIVNEQDAEVQKQKNIELEKKHQEQLQKNREKFEKIEKIRNQREDYEKKLQEMAQQLAPTIKREENALYKMTKAQQVRLKQTEEVKKKGLSGNVQVGFDPFAVVPIGGMKKADWMQ